MDLIKEEGDKLGESVDGFEKKLGVEEVEPPPSPPMYLASGLGLGLGIRDGFDSFREERENDEEYYRELLDEFPNHPFVLMKFAKFLQRKGDLQGAEEYIFVLQKLTLAMEKFCHNMLYWCGSSIVIRKEPRHTSIFLLKLLLRIAMFWHRMLSSFGK